MRLTRRGLFLTAGAALVAAPALAFFTDPFGTGRYRGRKSAHFDGERFRNPGPSDVRGFRDFLRWRRTARPRPWPDWLNTTPGPAPQRSVPDLRVTVVNHSTVLIQTAGMNILTDPVWSDRVSPVGFAGPRRHCAPGLRFEDLPPVHLVLVSHNHYDHLDVPTLKRLQAAHRPRVVVPLGVGEFLASQRIAFAAETDWWDATTLGALRIVSVPAQHFSGRGLRDRNQTLWCGFVLQGPAGTVYFAGDTGWGPHFAEIRERCGAPRLALLPVGAFEPRWFMAPVHLAPDEAVRAHHTLGASRSIGIHYGTFRLADEGYRDPASELDRAVVAAGNPDFRLLPFGQGHDIAPVLG